MTHEEYFDLASKPNFPDKMAFDLTGEDPDPETTFSAKGIADLANKMGLFLGARTIGQWQKSGIAPKKMRVILSIDWDPSGELKDMEYPYYEGFIESGGTPYIDARNRITWVDNSS